VKRSGEGNSEFVPFQLIFWNMEKRGLRRFAAAVAVCAFLLVVSGGLVTSNDAALSITDWPLAWGTWIPPLEGGIRFEFGHRALAAVVAVLSMILAVWSRKPLAWWSMAAVLTQAVAGGLLVRFTDPKTLAIVHAGWAELCFGLFVALVVEPRRGQTWKLGPLTAACGLLAQGIVGAAVRHGALGVLPHVAGAAVVTILVMAVGLSALLQQTQHVLLRRSALALLSLTFCQIFLGIGAYMARLATADAPQPMPLRIGFTTAHVALGSLAFGAAVVFAIVSGQVNSMNEEFAHRGMVTA
jgi:cytochrome c oxidase assembly protein subunit 15